jgi:hypothetical protein
MGRTTLSSSLRVIPRSVLLTERYDECPSGSTTTLPATPGVEKV